MADKKLHFDLARRDGGKQTAILLPSSRILTPKDAVRVTQSHREAQENSLEQHDWKEYIIKEAAVDDWDLYNDEGSGTDSDSNHYPDNLGYVYYAPGGTPLIEEGMTFEAHFRPTLSFTINYIEMEVELDGSWYDGPYQPSAVYAVSFAATASPAALIDSPNDGSLPVIDDQRTAGPNPSLCKYFYLNSSTVQNGKIFIELDVPFDVTLNTVYTLFLTPVYFYPPAGTTYAERGLRLKKDNSTGAATGVGTLKCATTGTTFTGNHLTWYDVTRTGLANTTDEYPAIRFLTAGSFPSPYYIDLDTNGDSLPIKETGQRNQVLVTDVALNPEASGNAAVPLPFFHYLRYPMVTERDDPRDSLKVYDTRFGGREVTAFKAKSQISQRGTADTLDVGIYLQEGVDASQLLEVRYDKSYEGVVTRNAKEIVDIRPAVQQGVNYEIDWQPDPARMYFVPSPSGQFVGVESPFAGDKVWVRKSPSTVVDLKPPIGDPEDAWYGRVGRGHFDVPSVPTDYGIKDISYFTPDVSGVPLAINWAGNSAILPVASGNLRLGKAVDETVDVLDVFTIQTQRRPIHFWDSDWASGQPNQWEFEQNDPLQPLISGYYPPHLLDPPYVTGVPTDEAMWYHGINIYINGQVMDNTSIIGWNQRSGIVRTNRAILPTDDVRATYLYEMEDLAGGPDLNTSAGHPNADKVGKAIRVVMKPAWDTYETDTTDPDGSGDRLCWHWLDDGDVTYNATWTAGVLDADSTTGYTWNTATEVGLPEHTVVVGDYVFQPPSLGSISLLDPRTRGGGIKEDAWLQYRAAVDDLEGRAATTTRGETQEESDYYWDIGHWDGQPYQADGTLIITIPSTVRTQIRNKIISEGVGGTKIHPADLTIADNYYAEFGKMDFDAIVGSGAIPDSRQDALQDYIDLHDASVLEMHRVLQAAVSKHIPLGQFYVIVDPDELQADGSGNIITGPGFGDGLSQPTSPLVDALLGTSRGSAVTTQDSGDDGSGRELLQ